MAVLLSMDVPDFSDTVTITADHFGLNFVSDFERIGDRGWEKYDEVLVFTGAQNLRYPGGITAETVFDITNPNAGELILPGGGTRQTMGAFDFAEYCRENGLTATFIIPTAAMLTDLEGVAHRGFDESFTQYVHDFVINVLVASGGNVSTFEIGNEYEGHMSSLEYGIVANSLAPIIAEAIAEYNSEHLGPESDPAIAVQVWSHFSNEDTLYDTSDLARRALRVFEQLDAEAVNAIDAIVTHWYARDHYRTYIDTYNDLELDIADALSVPTSFSENFEQALEVIVSEWNVNLHETIFWGLAQVPIVIKMFAEFVQAGVAQLDFWSAQYHANSLALNNGELTAIGQTFAYLETATIGTIAVDVDTGHENLGGVAFVGVDDAVLAISNITGNTVTYEFILPEYLSGPLDVSIGLLEVDESSSDGAYRDVANLDIFNEPDMAGEINWHDVSFISNSTITLSLDPFQTVFVEVTMEPAEDPTQGTEGDDILFSTASAEDFHGLGGNDTVDYLTSAVGVDISLELGIQISAGDVMDTFSSIENVNGSGFDDTLSGNEDNNVLNGNDGNDIISSLGGIDSVHGGAGDDLLILTGAGGLATGGHGNDVFNIVEGQYSIHGGAGYDIVDFSKFESGISIWIDEQTVELHEGRISIEKVESFLGSAFDDRFTMHSGDVDVDLKAGNDSVFFGPDASGSAKLNLGDDFIVSYSDSIAIFGGGGNDSIFSFGAATVQGGGGNDSIFLSDGHDEIIFSLSDGADRVTNFSLFDDTLTLSEEAIGELETGGFEVATTGFGAVLNFVDGGSIEFRDFSSQDVEYLVDLFL